MKINHKHFIDLAFQLAEKNLGLTGLNPSVGCVVVKNNKIISTGVTAKNGRPHSEYNALIKRKNFSGSNLYTTMEPCVHHGKTPPCVQIIIKKKIKKVFYSFEDPDLRTFQKSKKILNKYGIEVEKIKTKKFDKFYKSYFYNKKFKSPYITGKIAISNDFFTINKKKKWITNSKSRKIVHLFRSKQDSIISTSKSINIDNSLLNCRLKKTSLLRPDLFIVDLKLILKKKLALNKILKKRKTFIITNLKNRSRTLDYKKLGYQFIFVKSLKDKKDFNILFKRIYKLGYSRIFVETGLKFLNKLLKNKNINELYIFKSNKKLGKNGLNNDTPKNIKKNISKLITINLMGDKLYKKEF
jgi:diaminohydroxyphosphoribosylaminopyrimidine deaminase / 5-amino-6-(5-phosphoribosylamino)uracil reductase